MNDALKAKLAAAQNKTAVAPTTSTTPLVNAPTGKPEPAPEVEKSFHVFYHTLASCRMITATGRVINFVNHRYITDVVQDIEYLQKEIALGSTHLSTKAGEEVMTSSQLDPMKALKAKFIAEYEAEKAAKAAEIAAGVTPDMGSSEQQKLTPGSTTDIASLAIGS